MTDTKTILVVEDEKGIRNFIHNALTTNGYKTILAENGRNARAAFLSQCPDLVLLDLGLPDMDGIELLKEFRQWMQTPILIVSARDKEAEKVMALDLGADDYITKPFSVLELISRVRAILRRCSVDDRQDVIKLGQIVFDDSKHIVTSCGEECNLTFKEYELLKYLLKNKGMALTRENIILNVWGYDVEGESRTVDMHITTLRQKLGSCGNLIKTVRNVGYKAGE